MTSGTLTLFARTSVATVGTALGVVGAWFTSGQAIAVAVIHVGEPVTIVVDAVRAIGLRRRRSPAIVWAITLILTRVAIAVTAVRCVTIGVTVDIVFLAFAGPVTTAVGIRATAGPAVL